MAFNIAQVQKLYVAYFNRPADPAGLAFWQSKLSATVPATQAQLTTLASSFSVSPEYAALYAGQTNSQIINNLYLNLFGRNAETAGLNFWVGQLNAGTMTFAQIALQLTFSAQGTDATAINNKVTAATQFTKALDTPAKVAGYSGTAAAASARSFLSSVTDNSTTLTTAAAAEAAAAAAEAAEALEAAVAEAAEALEAAVAAAADEAAALQAEIDALEAAVAEAAEALEAAVVAAAAAAEAAEALEAAVAEAAEALEAAVAAAADEAAALQAEIDALEAAVAEAAEALEAAVAEAAEALEAAVAAAAAEAEALQAEIDALENPAGGTFVLTTGANSVFGVGIGDSITGTAATYTATDRIIDGVSGDGDTLTLTVTDDVTAAALVVAIETIQVNVNSLAAGGDVTLDFEAGRIYDSGISFDVIRANSTVDRLSVTNVQTGTTITASDAFDTVAVEGAEDGDLDITVNGDDVALTVTADTPTQNDLTVTAAGDVDVTAGDVVGDVVITAGGDVDVDATAVAGDVVITAGGDVTVIDLETVEGDVTITSGGDVVTGSLTLAEGDVVVVAAGAATVDVSAATSVSITAGDDSSVADTGAGAGGTIETLTVAGAMVLDAATTSPVGSANLTIAMSGGATVQIDGSAIAGTLDVTGASGNTLEISVEAGAALDLTGVATTVGITVSVDETGSYTVTSGAQLTYTVDQTDVTVNAEDEDEDTVTITAADNGGALALDLATVTLGTLASATLVAADTGTANTILTLLDGNADDTDVTLNASGKGWEVTDVDLGTGTLTLTGAGTITIDEITAAAAVVGTAATGVINIGAGTAVDLTAVTSVSTGSAADVVAVDADEADAADGAVVSTGAGNDTVTLTTVADTDIVTINFGTGDSDLLILVGTNLEGVTVSGLELIDLNGNAVTAESSFFSGESFFVTDSAGGAGLTLTASARVVDLSDIDFDTTIFDNTDQTTDVTVDASAITLSVTLTGSVLDDELVSGTKGGTFTGGDGLDIFDLAAIVTRNSVSITDFEATEEIQLDGNGTVIADGTIGDFTVADGIATNDDDAGTLASFLTWARGAADAEDFVGFVNGDDMVIFYQNASVASTDDVTITLVGGATLASVGGIASGSDVVMA